MKKIVLYLAGLAALSLSGGRVKADLIFDNYTSESAQYASTQSKVYLGAATFISNVASNTTITGITILNHVSASAVSTASIDFLIYDETTSQFVYQNADSFKGDGILGTSPTFKSSDAFSLMLLAGHSYDIGYVSDTNFNLPIADAGDLPSYTQNGLTATASNHSFGTSFGGNPITTTTVFSRMLPLQLSGPAVPAPASIILLGSGIVGVVARRIRRNR